MKKLSLLALIHPDGNANTPFVLGGNCPETLLAGTSVQADQKIDLFILAPTVRECRRPGWLESATGFVNQRLSDDGVCYVLVPPRWRLKLIRLFTQENLIVDSSFWHFPDWATTRYLIPFQQGPAQFAVDRIFSASSWKRDLANRIFRYPAAYQFLNTCWKSIGVSVRRPGARPLFQWLFPSDEEQLSPGTAIVRKSWREDQGAQILYCFEHSEALPSAIVKSVFTKASPAWLDHEAEVLELLDEGVRFSNAEVPHVLRKERTEQRSSLFLSPVRGQSASDLLRAHPDLLCGILTKTVGWLERWHAATVRFHALDVKKLEQAIFIPLEQLAPFVQNGEAYRNWLLQRILATTKTSLPCVATHNDLTMANILVDNELGVVDWETGLADSWPLVDFYYAVTDAVRIAHRFPSWLEAFQACFQPNGMYARDVQSWEQRLRSTIGVSANFSELCFHACWLHHAANENEVSRPGEPRPFLQIVQWLALNGTASQANQN